MDTFLHAPKLCRPLASIDGPQVWSHKRFSLDEFIGEASVSLGPLMDVRTHTYELPLTDPESKSVVEGTDRGSIHFELKYES